MGSEQSNHTHGRASCWGVKSCEPRNQVVTNESRVDRAPSGRVEPEINTGTGALSGALCVVLPGARLLGLQLTHLV